MRYNIQCTWIEENGMETSEFGATVAKEGIVVLTAPTT
jgi:hypothetical protein